MLLHSKFFMVDLALLCQCLDSMLLKVFSKLNYCHPEGRICSKKQRRKSVAPGRHRDTDYRRGFRKLWGGYITSPSQLLSASLKKKLSEVWCVLYAHQNQIAF